MAEAEAEAEAEVEALNEDTMALLEELTQTLESPAHYAQVISHLFQSSVESTSQQDQLELFNSLIRISADGNGNSNGNGNDNDNGNGPEQREWRAIVIRQQDNAELLALFDRARKRGISKQIMGKAESILNMAASSDGSEDPNTDQRGGRGRGRGQPEGDFLLYSRVEGDAVSLATVANQIHARFTPPAATEPGWTATADMVRILLHHIHDRKVLLGLHRTIKALSHRLPNSDVPNNLRIDNEPADNIMPMAVIELRDAVINWAQLEKTTLTPMLAAFYHMHASVMCIGLWHVIYNAFLAQDTDLGRWCETQVAAFTRRHPDRQMTNKARLRATLEKHFKGSWKNNWRRVQQVGAKLLPFVEHFESEGILLLLKPSWLDLWSRKDVPKLARSLAELLPGVKNFVKHGLDLNLCPLLFGRDSARFDAELWQPFLEIDPKTFTGYVADEFPYQAAAAALEAPGMDGMRREVQSKSNDLYDFVTTSPPRSHQTPQRKDLQLLRDRLTTRGHTDAEIEAHFRWAVLLRLYQIDEDAGVLELMPPRTEARRAPRGAGRARTPQDSRPSSTDTSSDVEGEDDGEDELRTPTPASRPPRRRQRFRSRTEEGSEDRASRRQRRE